jgi:hypothetical protein
MLNSTALRNFRKDLPNSAARNITKEKVYLFKNKIIKSKGEKK